MFLFRVKAGMHVPNALSGDERECGRGDGETAEVRYSQRPGNRETRRSNGSETCRIVTEGDKAIQIDRKKGSWHAEAKANAKAKANERVQARLSDL